MRQCLLSGHLRAGRPAHGPSWKVVGLRFVDMLELGVSSSNVSIFLSVWCLVALADCILSRYLGGLLVITSNLYSLYIINTIGGVLAQHLGILILLFCAIVHTHSR